MTVFCWARLKLSLIGDSRAEEGSPSTRPTKSWPSYEGETLDSDVSTLYHYTGARERIYSPSYQAYESYRSFLRDEFDFRCAYCLTREIWKEASDFELDHWCPDKEPESLRTDYDNLVFACRECNGSKLDRPIELKPLRDDFSQHLVFRLDGHAVPTSDKGRALIRKLSLNGPSRIDFRKRWLDVWQLAKEKGKEERVLGWPARLPNLTAVRPVSNRTNTERCYFKMQERGTLPELFFSERPKDEAWG